MENTQILLIQIHSVYMPNLHLSGIHISDFLKCSGSRTHVTHKIFGENFAAIYEIKPVLTPNLCWIHCFRIKQLVDV